MIRELGQQHTILHSTHFLSEVEQTCERIIIIDRGRVAAVGELAEMHRQHQNLEEFFVKLTELPAHSPEILAGPTTAMKGQS